jgi:RNA polymerase sigma-70 factor, ECF subfamily
LERSTGDISFSRVYDATVDRVYRLALAALHNHADADDVTAETFERALRSMPRFRGDEEQMTHWIFGIARNVVREYRRDRDRHHQPLPDAACLEVPEAPAEELSDMDVSHAVRRLAPAQREVLELRLSGLKIREVSTILGKPEGTVKALQHAAIRNVRTAVRG